MATVVKRDDNKQKWEETEFPLVCETCLGDNPYVRMTKEKHGKKCQVCERPFTVFAWQAGTKGRLKRVEICKSCAQSKNVCQVCIYDLQYGLPVKVRDKIMRESGATASSTALAVPQSDANRSWYVAKQERDLAQGQATCQIDDPGSRLAHAKLKEMACMEPRYERNLPKLCSFFAVGECNRGANCPFRHEMPRDRNDPLAKQTSRDRFYGQSDPVANKILGRKRKKEEMEKKRMEQGGDEGYNKARATLYLRFQGDEPYPALTEGIIRDAFYSYGEICSVRIQASKGQAFVEYTQPEACELAILEQSKKELSGRTIYTAWARAPKRGDQQTSRGASVASGEDSATAIPTTVVRPIAPPGATPSSRDSTDAPSLPKSMVPSVKLPPEVAAVVAARKKQNAAAANGGGIPGVGGLPRPSRGVGVLSSVPRPGRTGSYYPSADPARLGSKTSQQ